MLRAAGHGEKIEPEITDEVATLEEAVKLLKENTGMLLQQMGIMDLPGIPMEQKYNTPLERQIGEFRQDIAGCALIINRVISALGGLKLLIGGTDE